VILNAGRILSQQQIFGKGLERAIIAKLLPTIGIHGAWREHLYNGCGIRNCVPMLVQKLACAAPDHNVGIGEDVVTGAKKPVRSDIRCGTPLFARTPDTARQSFAPACPV
jgi:hypothetical protein